VQSSSPLSLALKVSELSDKASGEVMLSFDTEKKLYLASASLFDCDFGSVIPCGEYYRYPVSSFDRRFLSFDGSATKRGRKIGERVLYVSEDAVHIRYDADGIYEIPYLALPDTATLDGMDEEIFLSENAAALLVLLTAYYLAVEDENPAASFFLTRYEALRERVAAGKGEEGVVNVYGW